MQRERFVVALPAKHRLAAAKGKVSLRELAGEPFVTIPREIAPRLYDIVAQLAAQAGISLNVAQEAIQMQTVVSLVSSGLGAAIVPASVANLGRRGVVYRRSPSAIQASIYGWRGARGALAAPAATSWRSRGAWLCRCSSIPNIDPVAFSIGPLAVRWYGLMYLVGFAAAWWLGLRRIAKGHAPVTRAQFDDLLFLAVLGVILGGRLGYVLFYKPGYYAAHPLEIFAVWQGGMSFHGGLLGVMAAMAFAARRHHIDYLRSRTSSRRSCRSGSPPDAWATSSTASSGAGSPTCPGAWCFAMPAMLPRHPSQLYQFALEGSRSSSSSGGSRPSHARAARCRRCSSSATGCCGSSPNSHASPTLSSAISRSA